MRTGLASSGFTLLEIMVVVFILGLLVALVAPKVIHRGDVARVQAARTQIKSLEEAVHTFRLDTGRLPTSAEGLAVLVPPPPREVRNYDPEGYMETIPNDPWGNPFVYTSDGHSFEIVSFGNDGREGGDGYDADVSNHG